MESLEIEQLETAIQRLIDRCTRLQQENAKLREQHHGVERDYQISVERNRIARERINALLERLQTLETES